MNVTSGLDQLASFLKERGLHTTPVEANADLSVANPVATSLAEVVQCVSGRYLTSWGYEVGQVGQERSAACRLAYLLGVPDA